MKGSEKKGKCGLVQEGKRQILSLLSTEAGCFRILLSNLHPQYTVLSISSRVSLTIFFKIKTFLEIYTKYVCSLVLRLFAVNSIFLYD